MQARHSFESIVDARRKRAKGNFGQGRAGPTAILIRINPGNSPAEGDFILGRIYPSEEME